MSKWIVDECADANGFNTIRVDDGTPNGDLEAAVIATVYDDDNAARIIRAVNNHGKLVETLRTLTDEFASRLDGIYDATNEEIAALDCARNLLSSLES